MAAWRQPLNFRRSRVVSRRARPRFVQKSAAETVTAVLRLEGYAVDLASSASAALERVHQHLPGLVVADIRLDGSDGLTVGRAVREITRDSDRDLTGYASRNLEDAAQTIHALNRLLVKAADILVGDVEPDAVLGPICDFARRLRQANAYFVARCDAASNTWRVVCTDGYDQIDMATPLKSLREEETGATVFPRESVVIEDAGGIARLAGSDPAAALAGMRRSLSRCGPGLSWFGRSRFQCDGHARLRR